MCIRLEAGSPAEPCYVMYCIVSDSLTEMTEPEWCTGIKALQDISIKLHEESKSGLKPTVCSHNLQLCLKEELLVKTSCCSSHPPDPPDTTVKYDPDVLLLLFSLCFYLLLSAVPVVLSNHLSPPLRAFESL